MTATTRAAVMKRIGASQSGQPAAASPSSGRYDHTCSIGSPEPDYETGCGNGEQSCPEGPVDPDRTLEGGENLLCLGTRPYEVLDVLLLVLTSHRGQAEMNDDAEQHHDRGHHRVVDCWQPPGFPHPGHFFQDEQRYADHQAEHDGPERAGAIEPGHEQPEDINDHDGRDDVGQ